MEVLDELNDLTECCVCKEMYKDPKILPCVHTFCMKCLEEVGGKTSKGPGDQMPCPMCRKEFTIPVEGYTALQRNFFMEKLMETTRKASPWEGPDLCEACMEKESTSVFEVPSAVVYCSDCQKKLCEKCRRNHLKKKLTRNHQVVAVADLRCKPQAVVPSSCTKHKRVLDLYCSDCKELLCKLCFGKGHQNHKLQSTRNVVEGFKNEIGNILCGLNVCESGAREKKVSLNCKADKYCKNLESLKLEVRAQIDETIKLLSETANFTLEDIIGESVEKILDEIENEIEVIDGDLTNLESFKVYCTKVMTEGSACEICCTIDELKARFEGFDKAHASNAEPYIPFRETSFQKSRLKECVWTAGVKIIDAIEECLKEVMGEDKAEAASRDLSEDEDTEMEDCRRSPLSGKNCNPVIDRLKRKLEHKQRVICRYKKEKKAFKKRINELELELAAQPSCKSCVLGGTRGATPDSSMGSSQVKPWSPNASSSSAAFLPAMTDGMTPGAAGNLKTPIPGGGLSPIYMQSSPSTSSRNTCSSQRPDYSSRGSFRLFTRIRKF